MLACWDQEGSRPKVHASASHIAHICVFSAVDLAHKGSDGRCIDHAGQCQAIEIDVVGHTAISEGHSPATSVVLYFALMLWESDCSQRSSCRLSVGITFSRASKTGESRHLQERCVQVTYVVVEFKFECGP
jgi:hypothetical protein